MIIGYYAFSLSSNCAIHELIVILVCLYQVKFVEWILEYYEGTVYYCENNNKQS